MPFIAKGGLFAKLQTIAMGGAGISASVGGGMVGGAVGVAYLNEFCTFVDESDPESATGRAFDASFSLVTGVAAATTKAFDASFSLVTDVAAATKKLQALFW